MTILIRCARPRWQWLCAAFVVAMLATWTTAAAAGGGHPKLGHYRGYTNQSRISNLGEHSRLFSFKVANHGHRIEQLHTWIESRGAPRTRCDIEISVDRGRIHGGKFVLKRNPRRFPAFTVKGQYVSRTRARGTVSVAETGHGVYHCAKETGVKYWATWRHR